MLLDTGAESCCGPIVDDGEIWWCKTTVELAHGEHLPTKSAAAKVTIAGRTVHVDWTKTSAIPILGFGAIKQFRTTIDAMASPSDNCSGPPMSGT